MVVINPINLNEARLRRRISRPPAKIESLESLLEQVDTILINDLIKFGRRYAESIGCFLQLLEQSRSEDAQDQKSLEFIDHHEQEKVLSQLVLQARNDILLVLSQILETSFRFGENTKPEIGKLDYTRLGNKEQVIGIWLKSDITYSHAQFFIALDLFYFGLELYISNDLQACAYQKVYLLRYPVVVP